MFKGNINANNIGGFVPMANIKENISMNLTLTEKEVYELRNDLKKMYPHVGNSPSFVNLLNTFNITDDAIFTENFPSHEDIYGPDEPHVPTAGPQGGWLGLKDTAHHHVQKIFRGDYVRVINNPFYLYRVVSFKSNNNNKLSVVLVTLFERYVPMAPKYEVVAPESIEIVRENPLRFYTVGTQLYHKIKKENNWHVRNLHVSVWGHRFDAVTCMKSGIKGEEDKRYTVSIMDVVPDKERKCWQCGSPVYPQLNSDCEECRWLVCNCIKEGACGCQELGFKKQRV